MILIIGRTGSGKDYLARLLAKKGFSVLKSYTTRPKRSEDEDTHIFITPEESAAITDKVATTVINGYEYFATAEQVKNNDVYIIDPIGMDELTKNMPDEIFEVVYVSADREERKLNAVRRVATDKKIKEEKIFNARSASEDEQFSDFEDKLAAFREKLPTFPKNVVSVMEYSNHFQPEESENCAHMIAVRTTTQTVIKKLAEDAAGLGIFTTDNEHKGLIETVNDGERHFLPPDIISVMLLSRPSEFINFIVQYICCSPRFKDLMQDTHIKNPFDDN